MGTSSGAILPKATLSTCAPKGGLGCSTLRREQGNLGNLGNLSARTEEPSRLCSFAGVSIADVKTRFDEIKMVLKDRDHSASMSVGLAELQAQDTLQDLINRANETLIDGRGRSGHC